jgi:hypothetical protein
MHVEPTLSSPPWPLILGRPHSSFGALYNNSLLHWTSYRPQRLQLFRDLHAAQSYLLEKIRSNSVHGTNVLYFFLTTNHVVKLIMRAAPLSHYRPKPFVSTDGCRLLPTAICRHRPLPFLWCHFCTPFQLKFSKKKKTGLKFSQIYGFFGGEV